MTTQEQKIVAEAAAQLKKRFLHETTGHDWYHLERVWKMARKLASGEKVNQFIVELSALTHDLDDYKFKVKGEAELFQTEKFLTQFQLTDTQYQAIVEIITRVSYKGAAVTTKQISLEGMIVQDADRLDAMGAIGIARTFTYNASKGFPLYDPSIKVRPADNFKLYKKARSTAINHFYEKLLLLQERLNTPQAKKLGLRRHAFLQAYLTEFFLDLGETE